MKLINNINKFQNYVNLTSSFWRPRDHQEKEHGATDETENTLEIEEIGKLVIIEVVQILVLNCRSYFCESSVTQYGRKNTLAKVLEIALRAIERNVAKRKVMKNGRRKHQRKQICFSKVDDSRKN